MLTSPYYRPCAGACQTNYTEAGNVAEIRTGPIIQRPRRWQSFAPRARTADPANRVNVRGRQTGATDDWSGEPLDALRLPRRWSLVADRYQSAPAAAFRIAIPTPTRDPVANGT